MPDSSAFDIADLRRRHDHLQDVARQLKLEFLGIDRVIDHLVRSVSRWVLFPHMQERPLVVNLWGLTGVGKTALVHRLVELLEVEDRFFHYDLGGPVASRGIQGDLAEAARYLDGRPAVLLLDEFHHMRTIQDDESEGGLGRSTVLWQLLDTGRFMSSRHSFEMDVLIQFIERAEYLLKRGLQVHAGRVVHGVELFGLTIDKLSSGSDIAFQLRNLHKGLDHVDDEAEKQPPIFLPDTVVDAICNLQPTRFPLDVVVLEHISTMNGFQILQFLFDILDGANRTTSTDFSKALVIICGNLDEAYNIHGITSPDVDPDVFHRWTSKITVPQIKRALQKRFRSEEIARLGNDHILYPAFDRSTFRGLIDLRLRALAERFQDHTGMELRFTPALHRMLYDEGVYPVQGTRPLFSTIERLVAARLGEVVSHMVVHELRAEVIELSAEPSKLVVRYLHGDREVHVLRLDDQRVLEELREPSRDDTQAVTAVHEAGHAVLSVVLQKMLPTGIISRSASAGQGGFVQRPDRPDLIAKCDILPELAVLLGGITAEAAVFGEDRITTGGEHDLERATALITGLLRRSGMGRVHGRWGSQASMHDDILVDGDGAIDAEAQSWLERARHLARRTLDEQRDLLLHLADHLADHRDISEAHLRALIDHHATGVSNDDLDDDPNHRFYRAFLKSQVRHLRDAAAPGSGEDVGAEDATPVCSE